MRLHYLDWLQELAVLGVFLFRAVHSFDSLVELHIKNTERGVLTTLFSGFSTPWGKPFFFTMTGMTSWFSLRRRTLCDTLARRGVSAISQKTDRKRCLLPIICRAPVR